MFCLFFRDNTSFSKSYAGTIFFKLWHCVYISFLIEVVKFSSISLKFYDRLLKMCACFTQWERNIVILSGQMVCHQQWPIVIYRFDWCFTQYSRTLHTYDGSQRDGGNHLEYSMENLRIIRRLLEDGHVEKNPSCARLQLITTEAWPKRTLTVTGRYYKAFWCYRKPDP